MNMIQNSSPLEIKNNSKEIKNHSKGFFFKKFFFVSLFFISFLLSFLYFLNSKDFLGLKILESFPDRLNREFKIVILTISGTITYEETALYVRNSISKIKKDPLVKGVILKINSPGGSISGAELSYSLLKRFKMQSSMPIFAVIDAYGTSAAYYLGTAADKIFAKASSHVGSIGVILNYFVFEELLSRLGISYETYSTSDFSLYSLLKEKLTKEQKDYISDQMQFFKKNLFIKDVFEARKEKISFQNLKKYADGRVINGSFAQKIGLIDHIGIFEDAYDLMLKKLSIPEEKTFIEYYLLKDFLIELDPDYEFKLKVENFLMKTFSFFKKFKEIIHPFFLAFQDIKEFKGEKS